MKQAKFIISNFKHQPSFESLEKIQSYRKLLNFLPHTFRRGVLYMYNKNDTLFFVLEHPVNLMEFKNLQRDKQGKYRETFIKSKLREIIQIDKTCACIDATNIKAHLGKKPMIHKETKKETKPFFEEVSSGEFENKAKNKKIHKLFEDIRNIICSNKQ